MNDVYEFTKSTLTQGVDDETPYTSKNFNFVQDINSGSYTSGSGLSLVQFDLSSIYNSTKMIDPSQCYFTIPITYATAWTNSSNTTLIAPLQGAWASCGLKNGYFQLLQGLDLTVAGKVVEQFVPNLNQYVGFRMLLQMSQDDLKTIGASIGMGDTVDNWESMSYTSSTVNSPSTSSGVNATTPVTISNGMSNNAPFPINIPIASTTVNGVVSASATVVLTSATGVVVGQLASGTGILPNSYVTSLSTLTITLSQVATIATGAVITFYNETSTNTGDSANQGIQNSGTYNNGFFSRLKRIPDTTISATKNLTNFYGGAGCITSANNLKNEFRPYYTVVNNTCYWYDLAVIRCCDILDSMKQMPLVKRWDAQIRLYLNVGSVVSNVAQGGLQVISGSSITFTNTCPILQSAMSAYPATATTMASCLWIGSPVNTSISTAGGSLNLASGAPSHFMNACRFYYPQIELKPDKLISYVAKNLSKKICFTSCLNNSFSTISPATTSSFLVQSGVSNIRGLLILPFLTNSSGGNGTVAGTYTANVTPFS